MTTSTLTLTSFLLARIAEGEADAPNIYYWGTTGPDDFERLEGRMLAECEAKRRIVTLHREWKNFGDCATCGDVPQVEFPCDTIKALASVYADHPDYDEVWRP